MYSKHAVSRGRGGRGARCAAGCSAHSLNWHSFRGIYQACRMFYIKYRILPTRKTGIYWDPSCILKPFKYKVTNVPDLSVMFQNPLWRHNPQQGGCRVWEFLISWRWRAKYSNYPKSVYQLSSAADSVSPLQQRSIPRDL